MTVPEKSHPIADPGGEKNAECFQSVGFCWISSCSVDYGTLREGEQSKTDGGRGKD